MNAVDDWEGGVNSNLSSRALDDPFKNEVIMNKLVQYISPYDINCCRQVCHLWRNVFSCTNTFLKNFQLRLRFVYFKELLDLEDDMRSVTESTSNHSFLITEIPWKIMIFEEDEEILAHEDDLGVEDIVRRFVLEELASITIKGYSTIHKNIFTRIVANTDNLTHLSIDWLLLIKEALTVAVHSAQSMFPHNYLTHLTKLSINSSIKKMPSRQIDYILSHNLNLIFSHVRGLKSLSLLQGFENFEKMKRSMASFKEIFHENSASLHVLILDEAFFECLAYWPRLGNLKTFGVTLSSWEEQKLQLKVYMKYLVGQLTEFQFQSPYSNSHTNIFDQSGDGLSPMLVEYGQNLERLKLRSRIKTDTFPEDVTFIQSLVQLKELSFSGESPSHALLSYFTPGDELVAGLPLHLEKLYLRGFSVRNPFVITQLDQLTELCLNECKVRMDLLIKYILKPASRGGLVKLKVLELWDYQKSHGPKDYDFLGPEVPQDHHQASSEEIIESDSTNSVKLPPWSITHLKALQKLTLRRFDNISDNLCIHGIRLLPSLKYLDLGFCDYITPKGVEEVIRGCPYLQEVYVDDELELGHLNGMRDGRPVKIFGISCAPVIVGNFIHNLLERIVELSSGI